MPATSGFIGVADHGGWAVLVTVATDGAVLDRRRVELVDEDLPKLPHHHEAQGLPEEEAVALVERVRLSAHRHAALALEAVAAVSPPILGIALRTCQPLPPTIPERISNYRARNVADWVMYRRALASAAETRRWRVSWYDTKTVLKADLGARFRAVRKVLGPPWNKDHQLAMAAAIAMSKTMTGKGLYDE
jgi:hypothetical protein